jgi:hypothetical protein
MTKKTFKLQHPDGRVFNIDNSMRKTVEALLSAGDYDGLENLAMSKAKSGIHIKESKKGTFTAAATKRGKGVQEFASQVLANKENYSPAMVKKANFARNAAKWNKAEDGMQVDQNQQIQQVAQMVAQALQQGANPNQILQMLVQQGVPQQAAQQVIQMVMQQMEGQQQPQQEPQMQEQMPSMEYGGSPEEMQMQQQMQQQSMNQEGDQQQMEQVMAMVAQALQQGANPQQIMQMLVQQGVPQQIAQQVIAQVMQSMQQEQPQQGMPMEQMPQGAMGMRIKKAGLGVGMTGGLGSSSGLAMNPQLSALEQQYGKIQTPPDYNMYNIARNVRDARDSNKLLASIESGDASGYTPEDTKRIKTNRDLSNVLTAGYSLAAGRDAAMTGLNAYVTDKRNRQARAEYASNMQLDARSGSENQPYSPGYETKSGNLPMSKWGRRVKPCAECGHKMAYGGKLGFIAEHGVELPMHGRDLMSNNANVIVEGPGNRAEVGESIHDPNTGTVTNTRGLPTHEQQDAGLAEEQAYKVGEGGTILPQGLGITMGQVKDLFGHLPGVVEKLNVKYPYDDDMVSWGEIGNTQNTAPETMKIKKITKLGAQELLDIESAMNKQIKIKGKNEPRQSNPTLTSIGKTTAKLNTSKVDRDIAQYKQEAEAINQMVGQEVNGLKNIMDEKTRIHDEIFGVFDHLKTNLQAYGPEAAQDGMEKSEYGSRILPYADGGKRVKTIKELQQEYQKIKTDYSLSTEQQIRKLAKIKDQIQNLRVKGSANQAELDELQEERLKLLGPKYKDYTENDVTDYSTDIFTSVPQYKRYNRLKDKIYRLKDKQARYAERDPNVNATVAASSSPTTASSVNTTSPVNTASPSVVSPDPRSTAKGKYNFEEKDYVYSENPYANLDRTNLESQFPEYFKKRPKEYQDQMEELITEGRLLPRADFTGMPTIFNQKQNQYGTYGKVGQISELREKFPFFKNFEGDVLGHSFNIKDPEDTKKFQEWYNKRFKDEYNTTEGYFNEDSAGPFGVDSKTGEITYNFPLFIRKSYGPGATQFDENDPAVYYFENEGKAPKKEEKKSQYDPTDTGFRGNLLKGRNKNLFNDPLHPMAVAGPVMELLTPRDVTPLIEDTGAKDALAASTRKRFTENQPQLNRLRRATLAQTRGVGIDPVSQAQMVNAYANEYEAAGQAYGEKYNRDAAIEKDYIDMQNQLRREAGANRAKGLDLLAQREATSRWKKTAMDINALNTLGDRYLKNRAENRASLLYQDMFDNVGYDGYTTYTASNGEYPFALGTSGRPLTKEQLEYESVKIKNLKDRKEAKELGLPGYEKYGGKVKLPKKSVKRMSKVS